MKKIIGFLLIVQSVIILSAMAISAYDDVYTHPALTKKAVKLSNLDVYLNQYFTFQFNVGFVSMISGVPIIDWVASGSTAEDHPLCRASTHFHNPLKSWATAGASELSQTFPCPGYASPNSGTQYSALAWATGKNSYDGPFSKWDMQDSGWLSARSYYYSALTSNVATKRDTSFTETFKSVGQVMHLLQDMAVPAHVRDDFWISHVWRGLPNPYEGYVRDRENTKKDLIEPLHKWQIDQVRPNFATPRVTDFWDTSDETVAWPYQIVAEIVSGDKSYQFKSGLAEYSNANFLSEGTLFNNSNVFTYPKEESTNIVVLNMPNSTLRRPYYYKTADWDVGYILAGVDAVNFEKYGLDATKYSKTKKIPPLDKNVHQQYAERLVPRAVAYSSALLDYFFRGTLEISRPDTYIYAIADGNVDSDSYVYTDSSGNNFKHQKFTRIKAKVKNTTLNETMQPGTLRAVARYKIIPNYASDLSNYPPDGFVMTGNGTETNPGVQYTYAVSDEVQCSPLAYGEAQDFLFDFTKNPIPAGITDLTLQIVFKGTIGNEKDIAVAVGMVDLMEPTHLVFWNLSDRFSLYYEKQPYPDTKHHLYAFDSTVCPATTCTAPLLMNFQKGQINENLAVVGMLDTNGNQVLSDEDWLKPNLMSYSIAFSALSPTNILPPVASVPLGAGQHARLIVLVDDWYPYVQVAWPDKTEPSGIDWAADYFMAVWNQSYNGDWAAPTKRDSFRFGPVDEQQPAIPIVQHYNMGILNCYPGAFDSGGNKYCPYPEEEAPRVNLAPIAATIHFQ